MKKLRIICIYPTPYHLHRSNKLLKNGGQYTVRRFCYDSDWSIFKITFNRISLCKIRKRVQVAEFERLSNGISFVRFRQTVKNISAHYICCYCWQYRVFSKLLLNRNDFEKYVWDKKDAEFITFLMVYHFLYSDLWFENYVKTYEQIV